jgi:acyl-CoA synthetase (AMP-forming)/AMP-acid ligase II
MYSRALTVISSDGQALASSYYRTALRMNAQAFRQELKNRLRQNADRVLLRIVVEGSQEPTELTGAQILHESVGIAEKYSDIPKGGVVLLLLPHSVELFLLHLGLVLTSRIPAILAWPTTRVDPEKYQRNLLHQLRNLPAQQLITPPVLAANLAKGLPYQVTPCPVHAAARWETAFATTRDSLAATEVDRRTPRPDGELTEALFLQFSGGTTGSQKAVVISAEILSAQLDRLRDALAFTSEDSVVSWLPMYHDMGLIACLWQPLWHGAPSTQISASSWLMNPALLFHFIQRYQGTFCWLPNFAFSYLAIQRDRIEKNYSLHSMRAWINCSEPVRSHSMREFVSCYSDWGVTMDTVQASYAMAENVFAVTQTRLGEPANCIRRDSLRNNNATGELTFDLVENVYVSSGALLGDMKVRIIADGHACEEAQPGEIQLNTASLFSGYWGSNGYVVSGFTEDAWYATGDYGFMADGELYVIGRLKDIVIIGGQNIFPEDVEAVVNTIPEIYTGRVVAFGVVDQQTATESLIVVAEMRGAFDEERAHQLQRDIYKLVSSTISVAPRRVMVVPERWIVKSTAGKISRCETKERYLRDQLKQARSTGI